MAAKAAVGMAVTVSGVQVCVFKDGHKVVDTAAGWRGSVTQASTVVGQGGMGVNRPMNGVHFLSQLMIAYSAIQNIACSFFVAVVVLQKGLNRKNKKSKKKMKTGLF